MNWLPAILSPLRRDICQNWPKWLQRSSIMLIGGWPNLHLLVGNSIICLLSIYLLLFPAITASPLINCSLLLLNNHFLLLLQCLVFSLMLGKWGLFTMSSREHLNGWAPFMFFFIIMVSSDWAVLCRLNLIHYTLTFELLKWIVFSLGFHLLNVVQIGLIECQSVQILKSRDLVFQIIYLQYLSSWFPCKFLRRLECFVISLSPWWNH